MQPVDHLQVRIEIDALQRRHPRLENLQPAHRAVVTPLPWGHQARRPGRADAADEHQPGVARLGRIDRGFAFADFALADHLKLQSSVMFCAFMTFDHRARSASMNSAIAAGLRGRNTGKPIFSSEARNASSFRARSRLALIFCATSSGNLAGAAMPYQTLTT